MAERTGSLKVQQMEYYWVHSKVVLSVDERALLTALLTVVLMDSLKDFLLVEKMVE